jgi:hypothetical protein
MRTYAPNPPLKDSHLPISDLVCVMDMAGLTSALMGMYKVFPSVH